MNLRDFCFERSFLLRRSRRHAGRLIELAIRSLPENTWAVSEETKLLLSFNLMSILERDVRIRYGNPLVILILLKIIIPIIIQLVIQWWLNKEKDEN